MKARELAGERRYYIEEFRADTESATKLPLFTYPPPLRVTTLPLMGVDSTNSWRVCSIVSYVYKQNTTSGTSVGNEKGD